MYAERKYRNNVGSLLYRHLYSHLEFHRGVFRQGSKHRQLRWKKPVIAEFHKNSGLLTFTEEKIHKIFPHKERISPFFASIFPLFPQKRLILRLCSRASK